jgi:hypothetical protein
MDKNKCKKVVKLQKKGSKRKQKKGDFGKKKFKQAQKNSEWDGMEKGLEENIQGRAREEGEKKNLTQRQKINFSKKKKQDSPYQDWDDDVYS